MKPSSFFLGCCRPSLSLPERFSLAMGWVRTQTCGSAGIAVTSKKRQPYPEVSGYFIPTLKQWGERELAISYARWLLSIQNQDGSWSDPDGRNPYTFDTGQILKGLVALLDILPELETPVRKGCDWLLTQIQESGRIVTPDLGHWGLPGGRVVPEAIHLYALLPLRTAGERFSNQTYLDAVSRGLAYYCADPGLISFSTLAHFHAYILEALVDLGREDLAATGMVEIARLQKKDGSIPAYRDVGWVCSTAMFQYAVIWYKMGDAARGDRVFSAAVKMQNRSGGFFGSYGRGSTYFPDAEISWSIKYFLDALRWKILAGFDKEIDIFPKAIAESDGRYRIVADSVRANDPRNILEVGCGKGRFLRRLEADFPSVRLTGLDLSGLMLDSLPGSVVRLRSSLLDMPLVDGSFDCVFCVEALEHAVNINGAVRELCRVLAPGGTLIVIDKNRECLGQLRLAEWEQWFQENEISAMLQQQGLTVQTIRNIPYDGHDGSDRLFLGWVARKTVGKLC